MNNQKLKKRNREEQIFQDLLEEAKNKEDYYFKYLKIIKKLPKAKFIVWMHYVDCDCKVSEVAKRLNVSNAYIYKMVQEVRDRLKQVKI